MTSLKKFIYVEARRMSPGGAYAEEALSFHHVLVDATSVQDAYDKGWIEMTALNNRERAAKHGAQHWLGTLENDYVIPLEGLS
jgi:hypothetical protein